MNGFYFFLFFGTAEKEGGRGVILHKETTKNILT